MWSTAWRRSKAICARCAPHRPRRPRTGLRARAEPQAGGASASAAAGAPRSDPPEPKPELPRSGSRAGAFRRRPARIPCRARGAGRRRALPPRAISEILEPHAAPPRTCDRAGSAARSSARAGHTSGRAGVVAIRAHRRLGERDQPKFRSAPKEPVSTSSFIAAARRAAQAAAAQPVNEKAATRRCKAAAKPGGGRSAKSTRSARPATRSLRPSPPRSARCWSAQAWS